MLRAYDIYTFEITQSDPEKNDNELKNKHGPHHHLHHWLGFNAIARPGRAPTDQTTQATTGLHPHQARDGSTPTRRTSNAKAQVK